VDVRVFVAGETDETNLASFLGVEHGLLRAALGEDAVGSSKRMISGAG